MSEYSDIKDKEISRIKIKEIKISKNKFYQFREKLLNYLPALNEKYESRNSSFATPNPNSNSNIYLNNPNDIFDESNLCEICFERKKNTFLKCYVIIFSYRLINSYQYN